MSIHDHSNKFCKEELVNNNQPEICRIAKLLEKYQKLNDLCSLILEKRKNRKSGF